MAIPQYSCLENSMDREAWWATAHGVAKVGHNCLGGNARQEEPRAFPGQPVGLCRSPVASLYPVWASASDPRLSSPLWRSRGSQVPCPIHQLPLGPQLVTEVHFGEGMWLTAC